MSAVPGTTYLPPWLHDAAVAVAVAGPRIVPTAGSPAGTAWAAGCGAVAGLGLAVLVATRRRGAGAPPTRGAGGWRVRLERVRRDGATGPVLRRVAAAVAGFTVVGVVTRWPVAALLAAAGVWALPSVWRPDGDARDATDRLEAVAVWTELLRDTLSAAAGLEQAVLAAAAVAPDALAEPIAVLAGRLRDGEQLPVALRAFADDVDDPTMDLVVAALVLAATRQARDLTGLLSTLAQAARDQVVLRLRIAAGRAQVRTSVRIILLTTIGMISALVALNRDYLTVYDSPSGQLVLLLVGGLFAAAFLWLHRIAAVPRPPRILRPTPAPTPTSARTTTGPAGPGGPDGPGVGPRGGAR